MQLCVGFSGGKLRIYLVTCWCGMAAEEAKQLALSANERDNANQLKRIITGITFAAGKGDFEVNIYDNIKPDVRQSLLNHGHHVSEAMYDKNEISYTISWK